MNDATATPGFFRTYSKLFIIVGLIALTSIAGARGDWHAAMLNFMAGFFLVFSGLKLLDVPGFAKGYAKYDLLAEHVYAYGYLYPFLELTLGLLYLTRTELYATNIATIILMTFGGIGVIRSLALGRNFQCACLGTMINVPLTKVTIVENFGMALMAAWMLLS